MDPIQQIKSHLITCLSERLPGKASHLKMVPPGRRLELHDGEETSLRKSSVLIILYPENQTLYCILTKRPNTMKNHAGQIAFPGGVIEPSDKSAMDAALREANEEVGISVETVEIFGNLSPLIIPVSQFLVVPYIGWSKSNPNLKRNPYEVEQIIRFPISDFIGKNSFHSAQVDTFNGRMEVPCYIFNDLIIWGATAMILTELIDILNPERITSESH